MNFDDFMANKCKELDRKISSTLIPWITEALKEAYELGKSEDAIEADPFPNTETDFPSDKAAQELLGKMLQDIYDGKYETVTTYKPLVKKQQLLEDIGAGIEPHILRYVAPKQVNYYCAYDAYDGKPMQALGLVCYCPRCTGTC